MIGMKGSERNTTILIAEDDPDDRLLIKDAFEEARLNIHLRFVEDGDDLMDYLCLRGRYREHEQAPKPGIILLDLNMPKKDGREALGEIKADAKLRAIPIVILTTSREKEDIIRSYVLGANSYVTKPTTFKALAHVVKDLGRYWLKIVELPLNEIGD
jgi:CheY-like chemotaxis protein